MKQAITKDVGTLIERARLDAGLRLDDVALETGFSMKFLSNLEHHGVRDRTPFMHVLKVIESLGGKVVVEFPDVSERSGGDYE